MKPSIRYSLLTLLAVLCVGVALSASRLRLPAFTQSAGAATDRAQPAVGGDEADDPANAGRNVFVQTDKTDYAPGEVIIVSGGGWDPGEAVTLLLHEEPAIHADRRVTVIADESGSIFDNQFMQDAHDRGVMLQLTARGRNSGLSTQAMFGNPAANLDQWANLNNAWVNGNLGSSKAKYFEGDSIPYRLAFTNLDTTAVHHVTMQWDTLKGGKHALDYITTFNRSVKHVAPNVVPGETDIDTCAGVSGSACNNANWVAVAIPINADAPAAQIPGEFRLFGGGTVTDFTTSGYTIDALNSDHPTSITVNFKTTVANPVLVWGGHIATRLDWGSGNSAISISGSPYHTRLLDLDGSGGNQDRSLSSDAVVFPAKITIVKSANGATADFTFSATPAPLSGFTLTAGSSITPDPSKSFALNQNSQFTTYTVSEADPSPAYALSNVVCVEDQTQDSTVNVATRTATIKVQEGESITCTFTNTQQKGSLIVKKQVVNDNGGTKHATDFTFQVNSAAAVTFIQDGTDVLKGKNTVAADAGSYTVTEPAVTGYTTTYDNCTNVNIAAGGTATCTITNNDQSGSLIVKKLVINDNGGAKHATEFSFSKDGGAAVAFLQDGADVLKGKNTLTVDAGTYNITEPAVAGYTTTYDNCSSVVVANGGTQTCTITNDDQSGTLIVKKLVINDSGGTKHATDFSFQVNGGAATTFLQDGADVLKGKNTLTVDAGTYTVTEPAVNGYGTTYDNCSDVVIGNGGTATCTITNDDGKSTPAIATVMSWTLEDTTNLTILAGAPDASTGDNNKVRFKLYGPYLPDDTKDCDPSKLIFTSDLIPVVPDPSDATKVSASTRAQALGQNDGRVVTPGIYLWTSHYTGDSFNNPADSDCGKEVTEIKDISPSS